MKKEEIFARLQGIIAQHLEIEKAEINEHSIIRNLGADSIDDVEILLQAEDEFHVRIPDEALQITDMSVAQFVDIIAFLK